jgi:hypothetical protein
MSQKKKETNLILQLSIFVRNQPGELKKVTALLASNNVQIRAMTVAETADYGIFRVIVDNPEKCYNIMKENNFLVGKTDVLAIEMEDKPGGLHKIATILGDAGVNIEYFYAFAIKNKAVLVMQVTREHVEKAEAALKKNKINQFKPEDIYYI